MVNKIIVAIDGYSSCGKSTIAKALAKYAGYTYVDTGAMYRAVALYAVRAGIGHQILDVVEKLEDIHIGFSQTPEGQHVTLNGEDVAGVGFLQYNDALTTLCNSQVGIGNSYTFTGLSIIMGTIMSDIEDGGDC